MNEYWFVDDLPNGGMVVACMKQDTFSDEDVVAAE